MFLLAQESLSAGDSPRPAVAFSPIPIVGVTTTVYPRQSIVRWRHYGHQPCFPHAGPSWPLAGEAGLEKPVPAVDIRKSLAPDQSVCLDRGARMKMLKDPGIRLASSSADPA